VLLDDPIAHQKAKPGSPACGHSGEKGIKDIIQVLLGYATAGISKPDLRLSFRIDQGRDYKGVIPLSSSALIAAPILTDKKGFLT